MPSCLEPRRDELLRQIERRLDLIDAVAAQGLVPFLNQVVIDSRPEPRPFRDVADPWQWSLPSRYGPALEQVAGIKHPKAYTGPRNFWFTMPRGHDKTGSIGRACNWVLAYARRPRGMVAAAADREQAGLILESMQREAALNPWLDRRLKFRSYHVTGSSGSSLEVVSADANSSFGGKPDILILDELTHWAKSDLWGALYSGMEKRGRQALTLVITNAGTLKSWQHDILMAAKNDPTWYVYEVPHRTHLASWMSEEDIERRKKMLLPALARRVYDNEWLDPSEGCGWLTKAEAQACEELGRDLNLIQRFQGKPDIPYVAAVDYGPSRDRTVMAVMHREPPTDDSPERFVVDTMTVLQGSKQKHVPIAEVEAWLDWAIEKFPLAKIILDRYQLESTWQKFQIKAPVEVFEYRGGKSNYEMAQALRTAVVNGKLAWYPGCGMVQHKGSLHTLAEEFSEVVIKESAWGYRIDNRPGTHDDRVVTIGMALLGLIKLAPKRDLWLPEDEVDQDGKIVHECPWF